tara:strand:- start:140018 stop:140437 length:420 start_codon:yes stop_codon:yes gene_type:complete
MRAVAIEEEWGIHENDFLKGQYSPDQVGVELITIDRQKDGRWCDGGILLEELKSKRLIPIGEASSPEHFPPDWQGKQLAIIGTRYLRQQEHSRIIAIRLWAWDGQEGAWRCRMKHMDSDFSICPQRNASLRIPVFKILG